MRRLMGLIVAIIAIVVMSESCGIAEAATVTPARINLGKANTLYFGTNTFLTGKSVDTLVWSSDRNFADTAHYKCAVFLTNGTTAGPLGATILNDSSIIVTSQTAGDSVKYYFFEVLLQKR